MCILGEGQREIGEHRRRLLLRNSLCATLFCFDNKILLSLLYTEVINFIKIIIRDVCGGLGDCVNDYRVKEDGISMGIGGVCWHVSFQLPYETDSVLV